MGWFDKQEKDPRTVEIQGKPLRCLVCQGDSFRSREAQLNTAMASLLNVDWANATATCHVCASCGHIHWFA